MCHPFTLLGCEGEKAGVGWHAVSRCREKRGTATEEARDQYNVNALNLPTIGVRAAEMQLALVAVLGSIPCLL